MLLNQKKENPHERNWQPRKVIRKGPELDSTPKKLKMIKPVLELAVHENKHIYYNMLELRDSGT